MIGLTRHSPLILQRVPVKKAPAWRVGRLITLYRLYTLPLIHTCDLVSPAQFLMHLVVSDLGPDAHLLVILLCVSAGNPVSGLDPNMPM